MSGDAEGQLQARLRPDLYLAFRNLAATTIPRLGNNQPMHLLLAIFRLVLGFAWGGSWTALAYRASRMTGGGYASRQVEPSEVFLPIGGWMHVRLGLKRVGEPLDRYCLAPVTESGGGGDKLVRIAVASASRFPASSHFSSAFQSSLADWG